MHRPTTGVTATAGRRHPGLGAVLDMLAGGLAGTLVCLYAVSFASILVLPVAPEFLPLALRVGLAGAALAAAVAALSPGLAPTIWQPQSVVVLVLVAAAGPMAAAVPGGDPAAIYATLAAAVALTTLMTGAAMLAIGRAGLGGLAKAVPYPVMGGFLAATGALLIAQAVRLGAAGGDWREAAAVALWLPPATLAAAAVLLRRRAPRVPAFALAILVYLAALAAAERLGLTIPAYRTLGDLLPPAGAAPPVLPYRVGPVSAPALLAALPTTLAGVALALLGMLLNLAAIEREGRQRIGYDSELRGAGTANLLAGLLGGFVAYPSLTLTSLARMVHPRLGRAAVATLFLAIAALAVAGPWSLSGLPTGLLVLVLSYLGFDFLAKWLLTEARLMPRSDAVLMLAMFGVTLLRGFPVAVVAGILAAALRFTLAYARMPTLRNRLDGRLRLSPTERPDADLARLAVLGHETAIVQLQGFLFFGTANRLEAQLEAALETPGLTSLIVDFREVRGLDISAVQVFQEVLRRAAEREVAVWFTALAPHVKRDLGTALPPAARLRPTLDDALAPIEETLLARHPGHADPEATELARLLKAIEAAHPHLVAARETVPAGTTVLQRGAAADSFILLEHGRMYATLGSGPADGPRVATFLPGAVVGEIGLYAGLDRTASVVAETDCLLRRVTREGLEQLRSLDPARLLDLHALMAALLARRVARTNALVLNLERRAPE